MSIRVWLWCFSCVLVGLLDGAIRAHGLADFALSVAAGFWTVFAAKMIGREERVS
jgi:hypothetical protein